MPAAEKDARLQRLQAQIRGFEEVGTTQQVLVEGPSPRGGGQLTGRASNNRPVNFDGPAALTGRVVDVVVTEALTNSLRGRLAEPAAEAA